MTSIFTVTMPDIGEGVMEGEVVEWLKQVGDSLTQDEPVVVIMTDKATVELPAPYPGKLSKQYYQVGQIVIKDKPLYDIERSIKPIAQMQEPAKEEKKEKPVSTKPISKPSIGKATAAPPERKLAQELGLNIADIPGTGPEGRVMKEDILQYCNKNQTQSTPLLSLEGDHQEALVGIRGLMAKKMAESKSKIPHFSYFEQVDATRLVQLRHNFKEQAEKEGIAVTYMPFIIKALSNSLKQYPRVNSSFDSSKNAIIIHKRHNIGIAMSTKRGLIVPVLKDVQELSMNDIVPAYENLKIKALTEKLQPSDMKDATITISNFGVLGGSGLWATPIINFPEVAILAIARIQKQPLVKNGEVVVRDALNLSWSFDHRIIDGDEAAAFSHYFSTLLQNPASLL